MATPFGVKVDLSFQPAEVVGLSGNEFPRIVDRNQSLGMMGNGTFGTVCSVNLLPQQDTSTRVLISAAR